MGMQKQEQLAALREAREMREREKEQRRARVCRLARLGHTPTEIQRQVRMNQDTIRRILAEAGIALTLRPGVAPGEV